MIKINLSNKVFDGKWQWLYFLILDINDFLRCPLVFNVGDDNIFRNFNVDVKNWDKKSSKYALVKSLFEEMEKQAIVTVDIKKNEVKYKGELI